MLTAKENRSLTEVGKGKPMGEFMRRYWLPAAKSEEVPTAGGAPARVKLLGEQLVLFRSRDGENGLTFKSSHGGSCRQAAAAESIALNNGIASLVREDLDAWVHKRWTQCA